MGRPNGQYTYHELAMRAVLYLQKQRTREAKLAAALLVSRFNVSRATSYRLLAYAAQALGVTYRYETAGRHPGVTPKSMGYPRYCG